MPQPAPESQPRLSLGCRITMRQDVATLLYPEGAIRLQGTALRIVQLCDGVCSFQGIVTQLAHEYSADADRIQTEASAFLERLQAKRIIDF